MRRRSTQGDSWCVDFYYKGTDSPRPSLEYKRGSGGTKEHEEDGVADMSSSESILVSLWEVASRDELMKIIGRSSVNSLLLGLDEPEYHQKYYRVEIRVEGVQIALVGLISWGLGLEPGWIVKDGKVLIGSSSTVVSITPDDPVDWNETDLGTLFYKFVDLPEIPHVVVICETAVVGITVYGSKIWSVGLSDIVTNWKVIDNSLYREFFDGWPRMLDFSGNELPMPRKCMKPEIINISRTGFRMLLDGIELSVSFEDFPEFQKATIEQLLDIQWLTADHLYWPQLDIDLSVESIRNPSAFPLVARDEGKGSA